MTIFQKLLLTLIGGWAGGFSLLAKADDDTAQRVACVGDSITWGMGATKGHSYPSQLRILLGTGWKVANEGVSGTTLLNHGDLPYQTKGLLQHALQYRPNDVVIMLGANDSKPKNWVHKDEFVADYKQLIEKFKALDTHPRIFLCLPAPAPGKGNYGINEPTIEEEIPMIKSVAQDEQVNIIDVNSALKGLDGDFADRVHPNDAGAAVIAQTVAAALTAKTP